MSEEELIDFSKEELEFLKGLFSIISAFASSIANDTDTPITLQVDISTEGEKSENNENNG